MTHTYPSINHTPCQVRQVDFLPPLVPCGRCGQDAGRVDVATRTAIDIDLDHPAVLAVRVGVHYCPPCRHYFRAQPPFLRPDAIYTRRVVRKAVESVYADGLAFRTVGQRLARDFWVQPSEAIIRRWCRAYHTDIALDDAYQAWIVAEFSGILCVDELYQHDLALLLAVDPAAPEGDRVVGYQLVRDGVDSAVVEQFLTRLAAAGIQPDEQFLTRLAAAGIQPDEVITDGSTLYPSVLTAVWPQAAHQLCLFHETRRLTTAAQEVIRQVRRTLPTPPPAATYGWGGPLRAQPPSDNPADLAVQRWQARQEARRARIAQVQALAGQGLSLRAIARQLGLHRRTVRSWLRPAPPVRPAPPAPPAPPASDLHIVEPAASAPTRAYHRRTPALVAQIQQLSTQGLSYVEIARHTGVHRVSVSAWLREQGQEGEHPLPPGPEPVAAVDTLPAPSQDAPRADIPPASVLPPAPWTSWEEVRQVREALKEQRGLLLLRPDHLSSRQQAQVEALLASPVGPTLTVARDFLTDWYTLFKDERGRKRSVDEAQARYDLWRHDERYEELAPLRRARAQMTSDRFVHLSQFLRHPAWEATNNGAERAGRGFRHGQGPHFNLRSVASIEGALKVCAYRRKETADTLLPPVALCRRGRRLDGRIEDRVAA